MGRQQRFWSVLKTKQAASSDARQNVSAQDFEICHLMFRERPVRGVRRIRPLFPYYLLVRVDLRRDWRVLHSTRGVSTLFMSGDKPAIVADHHVEKFRQIQNELGYYEDRDHGEAPRFSRGEDVVVRNGWMTDCEGVYQGLAGLGPERVKVLFVILGQPKVMEMSAFDLASAA